MRGKGAAVGKLLKKRRRREQEMMRREREAYLWPNDGYSSSDGFGRLKDGFFGEKQHVGSVHCKRSDMSSIFVDSALGRLTSKNKFLVHNL
jgi:hypothetical protein